MKNWRGEIAFFVLCFLLLFASWLNGGGAWEFPKEPPEVAQDGLKLWRELEATRIAQDEIGLRDAVVYILKVEAKPFEKHLLIAYQGRPVRVFSSMESVTKHLKAMRAALLEKK